MKVEIEVKRVERKEIEDQDTKKVIPYFQATIDDGSVQGLKMSCTADFAAFFKKLFKGEDTVDYMPFISKVVKEGKVNFKLDALDLSANTEDDTINF